MRRFAGTIDSHTTILPGEGDPFAFGHVSGRFKIGGEASEERLAR